MKSQRAYESTNKIIGVRLRERAGSIRQIDPLILLSVAVSLFLAVQSDPWWGVTGATSSRPLTIDVSPYYFRMVATGISSEAPFVESLGSLTRLLSTLVSVALVAAASGLIRGGVNLRLISVSQRWQNSTSASSSCTTQPRQLFSAHMVYCLPTLARALFPLQLLDLT